ncbi:MAG: glycosyltransferase family 4 protein [Candidatus Beckwithbacteria bacterium]|nr:glycosyltransferase family 4 protein [Candidatus Beckwithbacteria bacterium]
MKPQLGILLNLGDSFKTYRQSGRDIHWFNNYLKYYLPAFGRPFVFSYDDEPNPFPKYIQLFVNKTGLPRFIYTFLIPFIYFKQLKSCQVLRVKQILGIWPGIIAKILWPTILVSTYGYDYTYFAKKEDHHLIPPFIKLTEYFGLKFSDRVIVTNPEMYDKVSRIIPKNKLVLLPNGVDTALFKPQKKKPGKYLEIISVGRLVYQKNFEAVIKAVSQVKTQRPIRLTIVGNGRLEEKLKALAKDLSVNLRIIPSLPHDQVAKLLQSGDIFIMASLHEGSPKALLEAMACGLSCVVADKPYSQFIISNNKDGLLVENTILGLTQGIQSLIDQPEKAKNISLQARQTVLHRFNNQTIIKKEISLLRSL